MTIAKNVTELNPHEEAARKLRAKVDMIIKSEGLSLKEMATESGIKYGTFTNWRMWDVRTSMLPTSA